MAQHRFGDVRGSGEHDTGDSNPDEAGTHGGTSVLSIRNLEDAPSIPAGADVVSAASSGLAAAGGTALTRQRSSSWSMGMISGSGGGGGGSARHHLVGKFFRGGGDGSSRSLISASPSPSPTRQRRERLWTAPDASPRFTVHTSPPPTASITAVSLGDNFSTEGGHTDGSGGDGDSDAEGVNAFPSTSFSASSSPDIDGVIWGTPHGMTTADISEWLNPLVQESTGSPGDGGAGPLSNAVTPAMLPMPPRLDYDEGGEEEEEKCEIGEYGDVSTSSSAGFALQPMFSGTVTLQPRSLVITPSLAGIPPTIEEEGLDLATPSRSSIIIDHKNNGSSSFLFIGGSECSSYDDDDDEEMEKSQRRVVRLESGDREPGELPDSFESEALPSTAAARRRNSRVGSDDNRRMPGPVYVMGVRIPFLRWPLPRPSKPSWSRVASFMVRKAPCFWCAGSDLDLASATDRAILVRLNILCAVFAAVQFGIGMFLFLAQWTWNGSPEEIRMEWKSLTPNLWTLNGMIFFLGIVGIVLVLAMLLTLRVIQNVNLAGAMRYMWFLYWIMPFEILLVISLFGMYQLVFVEYLQCLFAMT